MMLLNVHTTDPLLFSSPSGAPFVGNSLQVGLTSPSGTTTDTAPIGEEPAAIVPEPSSLWLTLSVVYSFFGLLWIASQRVEGRHPGQLSAPRSPAFTRDASHGLFSLRHWVATAVADQPGRPRIKMILLLWASWALAMFAYLSFIWAQ